MTVSQIFGNLQLWASLPFYILYHLYVTSFNGRDPEGRVTDTNVIYTKTIIDTCSIHTYSS